MEKLMVRFFNREKRERARKEMDGVSRVLAFFAVD
jgi:hypothetical protein